MNFFLGLITRCKDEIYIDEFVNYYINEGVDKIIIIDDDSSNKDIYKNLLNNNKVIIKINYFFLLIKTMNLKTYIHIIKQNVVLNQYFFLFYLSYY